ncbi:unnamed protein product [Medioppia subpectinata]|uniref:Uncharacterized protein n=1 Tax=Medioppia subpectinata TaxID=1979941 RepID=A0A7R9KYZ4_9ACAR|nr:unnamed protein product [Medioppia subpectinata]CAG2112491.1 unnamed protein product [Medioppia subpectinata]
MYTPIHVINPSVDHSPAVDTDSDYMHNLSLKLDSLLQSMDLLTSRDVTESTPIHVINPIQYHSPDSDNQLTKNLTQKLYSLLNNTDLMTAGVGGGGSPTHWNIVKKYFRKDFVEGKFPG